MDRLDLGQERLLGQVALVDLADLLVRPDDLVDEDRQREEDRGEDDDEARRDVRQDRVLRPLLHVAEGPVGAGQPEDDQVDRDRLERELDRGAAEEPAEGFPDLAEDLVHAGWWVPPNRLSAGRSPRPMPPDARGVRRSVTGATDAAPAVP